MCQCSIVGFDSYEHLQSRRDVDGREFHNNASDNAHNDSHSWLPLSFHADAFRRPDNEPPRAARRSGPLLPRVRGRAASEGPRTHALGGFRLFIIMHIFTNRGAIKQLMRFVTIFVLMTIIS